MKISVRQISPNSVSLNSAGKQPESENLAENTIDDKTNLAHILLKTSLLSLVITLGLFVVTILAIGVFAYSQVQKFSIAAGISPKDAWTTITAGLNSELVATNQAKNILILGVDALANRAGDPVLTDTIMIASVNTDTAATSLLSFPRDLWNETYQTKINALYFYGEDRYPIQPEQFTQEVLSEMTGVPIHHTVVVSLDQVADLIDALGGIEIDVATGFTDPQFPRDDVDIKTVTDPALLYETITFESGLQTMQGKRALAYIRSRHSSDDEGTDQARAARQQQVIAALLEKVISKEVLTNPAKLGQLFAFYNQHFAEKLPLSQVIALGKQLYQQRSNFNFTLNRANLSVAENGQPGVLIHPPLSQTQNQWAYTVTNQAAFKDEVWQKLNL